MDHQEAKKHAKQLLESGSNDQVADTLARLIQGLSNVAESVALLRDMVGEDSSPKEAFRLVVATAKGCERIANLALMGAIPHYHRAQRTEGRRGEEAVARSLLRNG